MAINKPSKSMLELLHQDLLGDIIARVATDSGEDFVSTISSSKELYLSQYDERVAKRINLSSLKKQPLNSYMYQAKMEVWLKENNPDAHYIEGILQYFVCKNKETGLAHLVKSANEGCHEACYLSRLLLMGSGKLEEGEKYFRMLNWESDMTLAYQTWMAIKVSLSKLPIKRDMSFLPAIQALKPTTPCDHFGLYMSCPRCFHHIALQNFHFWCKYY